MLNLILIGMPGAGKSTVGVILAKALKKTFIDTDIVIQEDSGRLLQEIIDTDGPRAFLEIEESTILSRQFANAVIATGSFPYCHPAGSLPYPVEHQTHHILFSPHTPTL